MTRLPSSLHNVTHWFRGQDPGIDEWIYVLPIAPATVPSDYVENELSPAFEGAWSNVAGKQACRICLTLGLHVVMQGAIDGGAAPSKVFTLLEGYRPVHAVPLIFPSSSSVGAYRGRVDPNGDVWLLGVL